MGNVVDGMAGSIRLMKWVGLASNVPLTLVCLPLTVGDARLIPTGPRYTAFRTVFTDCRHSGIARQPALTFDRRIMYEEEWEAAVRVLANRRLRQAASCSGKAGV